MSRVLNVNSFVVVSAQYKLEFLHFATSTYTKGNSENSVLGSGKLEKGLNSSFCSSLNRKCGGSGLAAD